MAEVVSKAFVFSSLSDCGIVHNHHHHHHRHHKVCSFLNKSPSFPLLKLRSSNLPSSDLYGHRLAINEPLSMSTFNRGNPKSAAFGAQMSIGIRRVQKWWEKGLQPNMHEVSGAQDLVDSLLSAGDNLVVLDFFSPGCGGCKALHPKICQLAEMNPDVQFLHVNYEEHKSMCYSLNVHVLPFFRFYRGAEGRVCSFSCTNATIKKFRDALAKYGADRCTLGPPKGLEEKELLALAANKDLAFEYTPKTEEPVPVSSPEKVTVSSTPKSEPHLPLPLPVTSNASQKAKQDSASEAMATSGR